MKQRRGLFPVVSARFYRMLMSSLRAITQEPKAAQGTKGTLDALWRITLNAKELVIRPSQEISGPVLLRDFLQSRKTLLLTAFF